MEKSECRIVVFPKVKNYHTVKLEDILTEGKIVGNGFVDETDLDKRECRVNFVGDLTEIKKPLPIGFVCEEHGTMIVLLKAEVSISGSKAVVKWQEIKRRKNLKGVMFVRINPNNTHIIQS